MAAISTDKSMIASCMMQDLSKILQKYPFKPYPPFGNEVAAFVSVLEGEFGPATAHIGVFNGAFSKYEFWMSVQVSFGRVRRVWANRTHLGEYGLASASWSYKTFHNPEDLAGSALHGNELIGAKWRHGVVGPKSRVGGGVDGYVQIDDIIKHLLGLERMARDIQRDRRDLSYGAWEHDSEEGW